MSNSLFHKSAQSKMTKHSTQQTASRNDRRSRSNTPFMISYKAICLATMILAVSSVDGFSSIGRRPVGVRTGPNETFLFADRRSSTEIYDDTSGNSNHDHNSQASFRQRLSSTRSFASTRLYSRAGNDGESAAGATDDQQEKAGARWWQSVVSVQQAPAPTEVDKEQEAVDEYLEFLDKRYKRLHENEKKMAEPAPKKFSALKWLTGDENDLVSQQEQEDALHVLGVAGLASERLLQKHQATLQQHKRRETVQEKKESPVVIDAVIEDVSQDVVVKTSPENRHALLLVTLRSVLKGISDRRKALISFQEKKLLSAMSLTLKAASKAPVKAGRALWNLGGGKKTVALTASVVFASFLVIRPVAHAMLREASHSN
jgi:hypothetical protein